MGSTISQQRELPTNDDDKRLKQLYRRSNVNSDNYRQPANGSNRQYQTNITTKNHRTNCKPSKNYAKQKNYHFDLTKQAEQTLKQFEGQQNMRVTQNSISQVYKIIPDVDGPIYYIQNKKATYQGHFQQINKQTLPNGKGKVFFKNGSFYAGGFKEGEANGTQGIFIFADGSYYSGAFVDGKFNGYGILTYKNKQMIYTGVFKDGKPHGIGTQSHQDGSTYEGQFINGNKQGKGIYTWPVQKQTGIRHKYRGQFYNGVMIGQGIIYQEATKQIVYWGGYKDGLKQGKGVLRTSRGSIYGNFIKDHVQGQGTFVWKQTGKVYEGQFSRSLMHGDGVIYFTSGQIVTGQWSEGHNIDVLQISNSEQARSKIQKIASAHQHHLKQGKQFMNKQKNHEQNILKSSISSSSPHSIDKYTSLKQANSLSRSNKQSSKKYDNSYDQGSKQEVGTPIRYTISKEGSSNDHNNNQRSQEMTTLNNKDMRSKDLQELHRKQSGKMQPRDSDD